MSEYNCAYFTWLDGYQFEDSGANCLMVDGGAWPTNNGDVSGGKTGTGELRPRCRRPSTLSIQRLSVCVLDKSRVTRATMHLSQSRHVCSAIRRPSAPRGRRPSAPGGRRPGAPGGRHPGAPGGRHPSAPGGRHHANNAASRLNGAGLMPHAAHIIGRVWSSFSCFMRPLARLRWRI